MRLSLFSSLLLHLGLLLLFRDWIFKSPEDRSEPVQIEFREVQAIQNDKKGGRGRRSTTLTPSLKNLTSKGESLFRPKTAQELDTLYTEAKGSGEWNGSDFGAKGGDFAQTEFLGEFDRLRREVENMLNYPGVLASRGIDGTINARIYFDDGSSCAWKRTKVIGASPYLRVYVTALLNKLCSLENIRHLHFRSGQSVDLSFQFAIVENRNLIPPPEHQAAITGNVLLFYRHVQKSKMEYQLGPIRGLWFVPAIALDPAWLVENWNTYVNHQDPLKDFR